MTQRAISKVPGVCARCDRVYVAGSVVLVLPSGVERRTGAGR